MRRRKSGRRNVLLLFCAVIALCFCMFFPDTVQQYALWLPELLWHGQTDGILEELPEYSGSPYAILNQNRPLFTQEEITDQAYEFYQFKDILGRCGTAMACVGLETMPTEGRESISEVTPSGWQVQKYAFVDQEYLYNRCHLIGFQLTGENANDRNLITGTRYMNIEGMLPFENQIAEYVHETGNHVMYRVTPIFEGADLVAAGVQMEAYSVEDQGEGVCFHVFAYNVQPGVEIDYLTGSSQAAAG